MKTIYNLVTLECENEHDLEHDLEHKTNFTKPRIYDANGDITERWYVYFSFRDPETGNLKRANNIYGKAHQYKTKAERYTLLNLYKRRLLKLLNEGYSPFEDNTELHKANMSIGILTTLGFCMYLYKLSLIFTCYLCLMYSFLSKIYLNIFHTWMVNQYH